MTEVFTSLKANVRAVSDSQHAAGLVNQERFDGIFLDLEMPNLHGFDLARVIRKSSWNKSTPIIIVTGRVRERPCNSDSRSELAFFRSRWIGKS